MGRELVRTFDSMHDVTVIDADEVPLESRDTCRRAIESETPDWVVNAAGCADADECERNPQYSQAVNLERPRNIALAAHEAGARLVHYSTDYVFDGSKGAPYTENDPCRPMAVYGGHAVKAEDYISTLSDRWLIIRTAWLFGLGENDYVRAVCDRAACGETISALDGPQGSLSYAVDVAVATRMLMEGDHAGVFHVSNRGRCTRWAMTREIVSIIGRDDVEVVPVSATEMPRAAAQPPHVVLSTRKLTDRTGRTLQFWQLALRHHIARLRDEPLREKVKKA